MALITIIAVNQTASPLALTQLMAPNGAIAASGQAQLTDWNYVEEILRDSELQGFIGDNSVLLTVNGAALTKEQSLAFMEAPTTPVKVSYGEFAAAPTTAEDALKGYSRGSIYITTGGAVYVCRSAGQGAAVWPEVQQTELAKIAGSTYSTIQEQQDIILSAGWVSGGVITDGGVNTVNVSLGSGFIRATNSPVAELLFMDWPAAAGVSVPSGSTRYLGVEYNAGSPQVVAKTTDTWDLRTEFPLGVVVNEAGTLYIEQNPQTVGDHPGLVLRRLHETQPLVRDERGGGLILGESGTRNFTMSAGALWDRLTRYIIPALDTNVTGSFDRYYSDGGGGFTKEAAQTQWPNLVYDDGSGTLATMTNNRFANLWFYVETDGQVIMMYGTAEYTSVLNAQAESVPADVPDRVLHESTLLGRIIFQQGVDPAAQIESAFDVMFSGGTATNHANLTNLAWQNSAHTGAVGSLATFDQAGAATFVSGNVQGDLAYFNGTVWVLFAPGTAGEFLQTQGSGSAPLWANPDHTALSNLPWASSGHTGTASTLAAFTAGGAATYLSTTLSGDVAGTIPGPLTVTDLTITSEAQGTILYFNGTNWVVLPVGTAGEVLQTNGAGANPSWGAADHTDLANLDWTSSGHTDTAGSLAAFTTGGAAALVTGAVHGDTLYFNGTNWIRLAPGTSGQFLQTQGSGSAPQWATGGGGGTFDHAALTLNLAWGSSAHTGTAGSLAAFDGTGATSFLTGTAQGDIAYFNGTIWTLLAPGVNGQVLQTQGAGANPQWVTGGAGTFDHALLTSNLAWLTSAHTGTASTFAAFNGAGATTHLTTTAGGDTTGTWPTLQVVDLTITGETQGDVLYFNGTNWVRLPPGTAGQVLATNGAGANPSWTDVGTLASRVDNITLTASSGSPYIETTSATYDTLAHIGFLGTNDNTPTQIAVLIGQANPGTVSARVYDVTNALVIAEATGLTNSVLALTDLGTLTNLSAGPATWQVQALKTGGGNKAQVGGLTVVY